MCAFLRHERCARIRLAIWPIRICQHRHVHRQVLPLAQQTNSPADYSHRGRDRRFSENLTGKAHVPLAEMAIGNIGIGIISTLATLNKNLGRKCFAFTKLDAGEIRRIKTEAFATISAEIERKRTT